jgi:multiple sugar transport system permease protein
MADAEHHARGEILMQKQSTPTSITQYTLAWVFAIIWLIPFLGIVITSMSPLEEVVHGWWGVRPSSLSLKNYIGALFHPTAPIGQGMLNSLIVAIPATMMPVFLASLAAYGIARFKFPFRKSIFLIIVLLLAIPQNMVAIPLFQILKNINLINTFAGLIIVHTSWGLPWVVLFMRGYFSTLPKEVEEAASMDGAGHWKTFFRIIVPASWPALASVASLQFTWVWNDFFLALIFLYDPDKLVATQRIPLLRGQYHVDWGILTAAAVLTTIAPLLVFVFLQKYHIQGFTGMSSK